MKARQVRRPRLSLLATAPVILVASGCLTDLERPETATFRLDSSGEVQVVTSTRFVSTSGGVELVESDTIVVTGPHEGSAELGFPTRFYIRAASLTEGNTVSMEVLIGDKQWYESTKTIGPDEALQFIYGFSGL